MSQSSKEKGIANVNIGSSGTEIDGAFGGDKETMSKYFMVTCVKPACPA